MICKATLNFYRMKPEEMQEHQAEAISRLFPDYKERFVKWREGKETYFSIDNEVADIHDLASLCLPMDVITFRPIPRLTMPAEAHAAMKQGDPIPATQVVHINLPGHDLLTVKQATVLENSCTEELDSWLKKGWKILAILPQPNHRRPDYIIGASTREDL